MDGLTLIDPHKVFRPPLEHNMGMSHKNGDSLELPFLYVEESIRLERD